MNKSNFRRVVRIHNSEHEVSGNGSGSRDGVYIHAGLVVVNLNDGNEVVHGADFFKSNEQLVSWAKSINAEIE